VENTGMGTGTEIFLEKISPRLSPAVEKTGIERMRLSAIVLQTMPTRSSARAHSSPDTEELAFIASPIVMDLRSSARAPREVGELWKTAVSSTSMRV
jgi:hypothetical protein